MAVCRGQGPEQRGGATVRPRGRREHRAGDQACAPACGSGSKCVGLEVAGGFPPGRRQPLARPAFLQHRGTSDPTNGRASIQVERGDCSIPTTSSKTITPTRSTPTSHPSVSQPPGALRPCQLPDTPLPANSPRQTTGTKIRLNHNLKTKRGKTRVKRFNSTKVPRCSGSPPASCLEARGRKPLRSGSVRH